MNYDLCVLSVGIVAKERMLNLTRNIKEEKGKVGGLCSFWVGFTVLLPKHL